ncbi:MAG TPA: glycosyltransferase [Acetobacteraceae bacterium]|nr:glycosyltransferase [Acetobacteraceae bacterium]
MADVACLAPLIDPDRQRPAIAFYMHDLSGGGVERMRLALAAALMARGVDVTLVLHARRGALLASLPPGLRVVELGGARTALDLPALVRFLRRARPDLLVSSLGHNNVVALLARALAGGGTRLVICQHNALSREAAEMPGLGYRALPLLYRGLHLLADRVVAVSGGVAEDLARVAGIPRGRISVIHNPVIGPDFVRRAEGPPPHPWFTDGRGPVFVSAGRLVPQKDPETLLRAFALMAPRGEGARLMLLGEGPMRPALEGLARELGIAGRVCFAGFRPNPLPYIRHAAALVLASRYEGLGNVLIEALGCGTPVISTDCPFGPAEILQGGRFGDLVPVGDALGLAAAMADTPRRRFPAEALRQRAAAFSVDRAAEAHLALLAAFSVGARRGALPLDPAGAGRPQTPLRLADSLVTSGRLQNNRGLGPLAPAGSRGGAPHAAAPEHAA